MCLVFRGIPIHVLFLIFSLGYLFFSYDFFGVLIYIYPWHESSSFMFANAPLSQRIDSIFTFLSCHLMTKFSYFKIILVGYGIYFYEGMICLDHWWKSHHLDIRGLWRTSVSFSATFTFSLISPEMGTPNPSISSVCFLLS